MWQELGTMFATMQWYIYLLLAIGIIMLLIEAFTPTFGVLGGIGTALYIIGVIVQGAITGSFLQILMLFLILAVLVIIVFIVLVRSARFGLLGKTALIENKTAVPVDYSDKKRNVMRTLVGKTGITITTFHPAGKFEVDKVVYEGITNGEMLDKGVLVKIVDVEGIKIRVEKKK